MNLFKRVSNIYKLSGISVNEVSPKANVVDQLAEVFKDPAAPKPEQKLATIINMKDDSSSE